jgi:hypothetical protein
MGGKTRAALLAAAALTLVVAVAAVASAATRVGFTVSPGRAHYGEEVTMTPSIDATAYPGDKFEIQVFTEMGAWEKWGEGLAVEETITPDVSGLAFAEPLTVLLDQSLEYPAILRAVYLPKSSSVATAASDPAVLRLTRNGATKLTAAAPKTAQKGKAFTISAQVLPLSGPGAVKVTVKRIGSSSRQNRVVQTDDEGYAEGTLTLKTAGRYTITFKFAGNIFGGPSNTVTKRVVVK